MLVAFIVVVVVEVVAAVFVESVVAVVVVLGVAVVVEVVVAVVVEVVEPVFLEMVVSTCPLDVSVAKFPLVVIRVFSSATVEPNYNKERCYNYSGK